MCPFIHEIENRKDIFHGYCTLPENKDVKEARKIVINPSYEGAEDRRYPVISSHAIPKWCKLPEYED